MLTSGTYSVGDIVADYGNLGIPHFQRGLTWSTDDAGRLLESLFHDTPCGSIILWKPLDAAATGLPLEGDTFQQLIVDGQQRVRSLHGAFKAGRHPDELDGVWCVNLLCVPKLRPLLQQRKLNRPLFIHVRDPREHARQNQQSRAEHAKQNEQARPDDKKPFRPNPFKYENNVVPLKWLLDDQNKNATWPHIKKADVENRSLIDTEIDQLRADLREMQKRKMFVVVRMESDAADHNWNLASMVELYNRINSAGIRVEPEERAFASVVAAVPTFNPALLKLFTKVHPQRKGGSPEGRLDRDAALARTRERSFGFKLFMRTFLQTVCVHSSTSVAREGLAFDVLKSRLSDNAASKSDDLFTRWQEATLLVAETLRCDHLLHCDDFGFVPDARSLIPAFQLALHFDGCGAADAGKRDRLLKTVLAWVVLKLMLDPPDEKASIKLAREIQRADTLSDAVRHVKRVQGQPRKALLEQLAKANSLNNRYALLLYWLVRRRAAQNFTFAFVDKTKRSEKILAVKEHINSASDPEKAHIVAYAQLRDAYGVRDDADDADVNGNRATKHPINNIGNLTYLSHDTNHWEKGFGDKWMDLASESDVNKTAHLLTGGARHSDVLKFYEKARRADSAEKPGDLKKSFEAMCMARRKLIADAFMEWEEELSTNAKKAIDDAGRITPVRPLFKPDVADLVRECGYSLAMEDALLSLYRKDQMQIAAKGSSHVAFRVRLKQTKGGTLDAQLPRRREGKGTLLLNRPGGKAGSVPRFEEAAVQLGLVPGLAAPFEHDGADESATLRMLETLTTLASKPTSGRTTLSQGATD